MKEKMVHEKGEYCPREKKYCPTQKNTIWVRKIIPVEIRTSTVTDEGRHQSQKNRYFWQIQRQAKENYLRLS